MFGKGTFKSSHNFRPNSSALASVQNKSIPSDDLLKFNEAEIAANSNEIVKAVELYTQFILCESSNSDDGTSLCFIVFLL